MRGAGWESTVIDAALSGNVLSVNDTSHVTIEGFTLRRGANALQRRGVERLEPGPA